MDEGQGCRSAAGRGQGLRRARRRRARDPLQRLRGSPTVIEADVARSRAARRRGLLGRPRVDRPLVLVPCRQVHTLGMRVPIDVVWCDRRGKVLRMATLRPGRVSRPVLRARFVLEAAAGAAAAWGLRRGDPITIEEHRGA